MAYYTIQPPASLSNYVRFFWVLESEETAYIHRSFADVCTEMVFHYKGTFDELKSQNQYEASFASGIQGQSKHLRMFKTNEAFGIFGIYFFPYTISVLTRTPASEICNQMIDLKSILGKEGIVLEEQMMSAHSNDHRLKNITQFLESRLVSQNVSKSSMAHAVQFILGSHGHTRISQLANDYGLSERHFERKFKIHTGLSPKLFSRIVRFQYAVNQYAIPSSLTEIAYTCGYFDQSHFIHEFKQFSGFHPGVFFSGKAEGSSWLD